MGVCYTKLSGGKPRPTPAPPSGYGSGTCANQRSFSLFPSSTKAGEDQSRKVVFTPGGSAQSVAGSREDARIAQEVRQVFEKHQGRYGSPRIQRDLHEEGIS